jgi:hypothetical protein
LNGATDQQQVPPPPSPSPSLLSLESRTWSKGHSSFFRLVKSWRENRVLAGRRDHARANLIRRGSFSGTRAPFFPPFRLSIDPAHRATLSILRTMTLAGAKTTSWPFVPRHSEPVTPAVDDDLPSLGQANTFSGLPRALGDTHARRTISAARHGASSIGRGHDGRRAGLLSTHVFAPKRLPRRKSYVDEWVMLLRLRKGRCCCYLHIARHDPRDVQ